MINLISPANKKQLHAAKTNAVLLNYCVILFIFALLLSSIFGAGFWLTWQDRATADTQRKQGDQASAAYATTKQTAIEFKDNLKQAKQILGNQVSMYDLITKIAGVMPQGAILSNLAVGTTSLGAPLSISAKAQTYDAAVKLKDNLNSSHIFSSVSIVNITTNVVDPKQDPIGAIYPVVVNLSAQFSPQISNPTPATGAKK